MALICRSPKCITKKEMCALKNKRFRPYIDKLFWIILIPTVLLLIAVTALSCGELIPLLLLLAIDIFTLYFLISPLFGYVELRESSVFIKFGFIMKREIPYSKIRGITKVRKFYADSMMSLKNSFEHINIKYNTFDIVSISVIDNNGFIDELNLKLSR